MKKMLLVMITVTLMPSVYSQTGVNVNSDARKKEGYFNSTQIGFLMGNRSRSEPFSYYYGNRNRLQVAPSATMTNGYIFNEKVAIGIGVGYEIFDHNHFPVFLDIRRTVWDNKVSPFFGLKIGHAIGNLKKKYYENLYFDYGTYNDVYFRNYGGFMLNPEMGVKIPLSENADILFTVAYRYQKSKIKVSQKNYSHIDWERKESMNRMSFGIAVMFR